MTRGAERAVVGVAAAVSVVNVMTALFLLPYSPGFDERTLYLAIYSFEHYGRLMYPFYDLPLMVAHPPTKYWMVGALVSSGVPLRLATGGLFLAAYLFALGGILACRFATFRSLAAIFALGTAATLCPFVAYAPENPALADIIGRVRPDDLVFALWCGGLFWLEAARRHGWRTAYTFAGAFGVALASASHYSGVPGILTVAVYAAAALIERRGARRRVLAVMTAAVLLVLVPFLLAVGSHLPQMIAIVARQGGDTTRAFSEGWKRHAGDLWFLVAWSKSHWPNVWAARALLAGPVALSIPPIVVGGAVLLAFPSARWFALAALPLPLAIIFAGHKWIGYELPEIAIYLLACGWVVASLLERLSVPRLRLAASALCVMPLATATPLLWDAGSLRFMDGSHSPELLRAMGRSVVGPGATMVGSYYTGGEDNFILGGSLDQQGVDYAAERDFETYGAALHDLYFAGKARLAGFVLTPGAPSASVVYFASPRTPVRPLTGFVARDDGVQQFSTSGRGWTFETLSCRATPEELPWASPRPPVVISMYVPRTDHCVNRTLSTRGLDGRFASLFMRRSYGDGRMDPSAVVALLIDDEAAGSAGSALADTCGCRTIEAIPGGLTAVPASALVSGLERSDAVIRFYATPADFLANRSMYRRYFGHDDPVR